MNIGIATPGKTTPRKLTPKNRAAALKMRKAVAVECGWVLK
jgi:hypothetical protein